MTRRISGARTTISNHYRAAARPAGRFRRRPPVLGGTVARLLAGRPPEVDLAYARAVAANAFARGGKDNSTSWQKPNTGAGGHITPVATSYVEGDLTCHDFLASYVHVETETWLQGEACQTDNGKWCKELQAPSIAAKQTGEGRRRSPPAQRLQLASKL
jgi:17 kDa outer membrane surface antigen